MRLIQRLTSFYFTGATHNCAHRHSNSIRNAIATGAIFSIAAIPTMAIAQSTATPPSAPPTTIIQAFDRAFFSNQPGFFGDLSINRQIKSILGFGAFNRNGYPESEIQRDARLLGIVYQDVLKQQAQSDRTIRTPDLPNPYATSILSSPRVDVTTPSQQQELLFEPPSP